MLYLSRPFSIQGRWQNIENRYLAPHRLELEVPSFGLFIWYRFTSLFSFLFKFSLLYPLTSFLVYFLNTLIPPHTHTHLFFFTYSLQSIVSLPSSNSFAFSVFLSFFGTNTFFTITTQMLIHSFLLSLIFFMSLSLSSSC